MRDTARRERLGSRLGFILLSAGCAIGLGNVWRFPYVAGQNGGGWFVALYLVFLALIGVPILTMEFAAGRAAQRSIAKIHATLTPGRPAWCLHGVAGAAGNTLLMMFYTTVTGWMLLYFVKSAAGTFAGMTPGEIGAEFDRTLAGAWPQALAMLAVSLSCAVVCAAGLQRGLERVTKWMMLALFLLIAALAVNSLTLDGALRGLRFYLVPDFSRMKSVGVARVVVEAMNQAFFTLSLGIGAMSIFGSYIDRRHALLKEALHVAAIDTAIAIAAGLVVIPACFAFGVDQAQGPGLVFVTLPNVFGHMPGGRLWGTMFFLFMGCAALTTAFSVFESILACLRDYTGWSRRRGCVALGAAIPLLSLPCVFGFNLWRGFQPLGAGSCVLDLEDFVVSALLLPLGGIAFSLYCCHRFGWGWERFRAEANAGAGARLPGGFVRFYCAWLLPPVVALVFVAGILDRFNVIRL